MGPNSPGAKAAPKSFPPAQAAGSTGTPHPAPQHHVVTPNAPTPGHHDRVQAMINKPQGGPGRDASRE